MTTKGTSLVVQAKIKGLLREHFARAKSRNPSFSLRAFARHLGLAPSALSSLMNSSRPVTLRSARLILNGLGLPPDEIAPLLAGLHKRNNEPVREYSLIEADAFHLINDATYFTMLSMLQTTNAPRTEEALASRMGLSAKRTGACVARLKRLQLVRHTRQGLLKTTGQRLTSTIDVPSAAIQRFHAQGLELAKQALFEVNVEERDFSASTIAIDPSKVPEAKRRIEAFRQSLSAFLESGSRTVVYRFNTQLFPLEKTHHSNPDTKK